MTWLAKLIGVTLFCVVANGGSRSAPFALNEEPNLVSPQVTAPTKPQEVHYDPDAGDEDLTSEKGPSVNGAGSDYGAVPARSYGNYFAALEYWDSKEVDGEDVVSAMVKR